MKKDTDNNSGSPAQQEAKSLFNISTDDYIENFDDEEEEDIIDWFKKKKEEQEKKIQARKQRLERMGTANALTAFYRENSESDPDVLNFLSTIPERLRDIAKTFCECFGRAPLKSERQRWIRELNDLNAMGVLGVDIIIAYKYHAENNLLIKAPGSISAAAWQASRARRLGKNDQNESETVLEKMKNFEAELEERKDNRNDNYYIST